MGGCKRYMTTALCVVVGAARAGPEARVHALPGTHMLVCAHHNRYAAWHLPRQLRRDDVPPQPVLTLPYVRVCVCVRARARVLLLAVRDFRCAACGPPVMKGLLVRSISALVRARRGEAGRVSLPRVRACMTYRRQHVLARSKACTYGPPVTSEGITWPAT